MQFSSTPSWRYPRWYKTLQNVFFVFPPIARSDAHGEYLDIFSFFLIILILLTQSFILSFLPICNCSSVLISYGIYSIIYLLFACTSKTRPIDDWPSCTSHTYDPHQERYPHIKQKQITTNQMLETHSPLESRSCNAHQLLIL